MAPEPAFWGRVEEDIFKTFCMRGDCTVKRLFTVMFIALLILPLAANAGQFQRGDRTLSLGGSGSSSNDFDASNFNTEISYGKFFRDNIEVSVRQGLSFADTGGDSAFNGSTRFAADYYFDFITDERWQPFAGVNIGYLYGDTVKEQFIAGPEIGARYFVNNTTFIAGTIEYQFLFEDAEGAENAYDDGRFVYALFVGFKF